MASEPVPAPPPTSRTTIAPKVELTAWQMTFDNLSTRAREIAAIAAFVYLARCGLLEGRWCAIAIMAIVLPIEVTRQIAKGVVGRASAITGSGAIALVVISKLHAALTTVPLAAALVASLAGCAAAQHPHTWDENARIATNSAGHALRVIDTGLATRYAQLAPVADDLESVDAQFRPALAAERLALDALFAAEHAVDTAVATGSIADRCRARLLLTRAKLHTEDAIRIARDAGLTIDDATTRTITTLEQALAAFAPTCEGSPAP